MTAEERLAKVRHIVVVMMENRSFDHMLGYLSLPDTPNRIDEVRGLRGPDQDVNVDAEGGEHPIHAFDTQDHKVQRRGEPLDKMLDPDHSPAGVKKQIGERMDGFVREYVESRAKRGYEDFPRELWGVPMGYYTAKDVPVYDHLAHNYCLCDAWHASIPGDTWPNRCYSIAGRQGDSVWKQSNLFRRLAEKSSLIAKLRSVPVYDLEAFTRWLQPEQWRWYSHDPSTLRAVDPEYRRFSDLKLDNFTWFNRRRWAPTKILQEDVLHIVAADSFLDDAAKGELREVSWIDPNFFDVNVLDPHSNDDHPPSDILAGQQFVLDVYETLRRSPNWGDTVLVITYDEHGRFYDHVRPPAATDDPRHETLGVRVPALVVGPRVTRGVHHEAPGDEAWEHTALIRSILLRFHPDPERALAEMGDRVAERTAHIGLMLEDEPRTDLPPEATDPRERPEPEERLREWRAEAREARLPSGESASVAPDGAGQPVVTTEWQQEYLKFATAMREAGMQPNELSERQRAKGPEEPGPPAEPQPA
jgi:phospholipase C